MPKFGEDLKNITIAVGREAVFICNVEGLATYKVFFITYILEDRHEVTVTLKHIINEIIVNLPLLN